MLSTTLLNVLMVEDNPGDQFLLTELLGLSVLSIEKIHKATKICEACTIVQANKIDIILLDLSLPDSAGIKSFNTIRRCASNIPIVILSGLDDMKVALDAINHGAQDYLQKGDFDEKLLAKTILYSIERMRSLRELKESNERYDLISRATNDMVWDWDLITGKVYRNEQGWKKIFGSAYDESKDGNANGWRNKIHPDDKEKVIAVTRAIHEIADRDFFEVECRVIKDDGSCCYIHDRGYVIRDENGKAIRLIGSTQDITARKEAEMNLQKSELRFKSLVQNGSDLMSILDKDANYTYTTPAMKRIMGHDADWIVGKSAFSFIHPDDLEAIQQAHREYSPTSNNTLTPFRFRNAAGEWRWLETKITDLTSIPEVNGFVVNSRDITERKNAEEEIRKLSIIAQETVNAVIITDACGKITWVNEAFTKITEYTSAEVIGKRPGDFLQGKDTSPSAMRLMHARIKNLEPFDCDVLNYAKSGRKYWVRIQCQPQFDDRGSLQGFFAMQTDISKEKEAEEILKSSEEQYRYLFNNNPASILIWDPETAAILEVNQTAVVLFGYSRDTFLSKKITALGLPKTHNRKPGQQTARIAKCVTNSGEEIYVNIDSHLIQYKGRIVILGLATNITDKVVLEKKLEEERTARTQEVTNAVISAQEQERQEIGRELHDNINQILASALLYLGLVKSEYGQSMLDEGSKLVSSAINEIRKLSHALIPPMIDDAALFEALELIVNITQKASGISIELQAEGFDERLISDKLKLSVYRIVQEQFNNILKYANAKNVLVYLVRERDRLLLSIKDDGVGFDPHIKVHGVGLTNIRTRASLFNGEMFINTAPGKGCEVQVYFDCCHSRHLSTL